MTTVSNLHSPKKFRIYNMTIRSRQVICKNLSFEPELHVESPSKQNQERNSNINQYNYSTIFLRNMNR